jgi:hypothetical protein
VSHTKRYIGATALLCSMAMSQCVFAACGVVPGTKLSSTNAPLLTKCSFTDPKPTQFNPQGTGTYRCNQSILTSMPRVLHGDDSFFDDSQMMAALSRESELVGILRYQSEKASVQLNAGRTEDSGKNDAVAWGRWTQGQIMQLPEIRSSGKVLTNTTLSPEINLHYAVGIESRTQHMNDIVMGLVPFDSQILPECKTAYRLIASTRPTIDGRDQDGHAVEPGNIEHADRLIVDFQDRNSAVAHFSLRIGKIIEDAQLSLKRLPREDRFTGGYNDRLTQGEDDPKGGVRDCPEVPNPNHSCFNAKVRGYFYGRQGEYLAIKYHMPANNLLSVAAKSSSNYRYRYNTISGILIYQKD